MQSPATRGARFMMKDRTRYAINASGWTVFGIWPDTEPRRAFTGFSRCGFTTSLRLMGALSLTAAAVSGLELPAWPDRHVLVAPPFIEPVSLSVHRAPFEPTSLRASRAPDGAHHVPGFEPAEARFMMSDLTGMP